MPMIDMPIKESVAVELGNFRHQDEDELFLRHLSVYATVRGDIKSRTQPLSRHSSLSDIIERWNTPEHATDESKEEESTLPCGELQSHELLVKGFHVDERIAPGFRYSVRHIGDAGHLFDGEARRLESLGLGYGRRLTFQGDRLNFNDCYFWSDSSPDGFAFNIEAVREGDSFTILDADHKELGTVEVQKVEYPQVEQDTKIEDKDVVKNVSVRFACSIKHFHSQHSLVNVDVQEFEVVEGVAELVKTRGSKEAKVRCVRGVYFQKLGHCTLHAE